MLGISICELHILLCCQNTSLCGTGGHKYHAMRVSAAAGARARRYSTPDGPIEGLGTSLHADGTSGYMPGSSLVRHVSLPPLRPHHGLTDEPHTFRPPK